MLNSRLLPAAPRQRGLLLLMLCSLIMATLIASGLYWWAPQNVQTKKETLK